MVGQDYIHLFLAHRLLMQVAVEEEHGLAMSPVLLIIHMQEMGELVAVEMELMWTPV